MSNRSHEASRAASSERHRTINCNEVRDSSGTCNTTDSASSTDGGNDATISPESGSITKLRGRITSSAVTTPAKWRCRNRIGSCAGSMMGVASVKRASSLEPGTIANRPENKSKTTAGPHSGPANDREILNADQDCRSSGSPVRECERAIARELCAAAIWQGPPRPP